MAKVEHKVVAEFRSSPIIYGVDSRDRRENPDYHPVVRLTDKGLFVNEAGRVLEATEVPEYVKKLAKGTSKSTTVHAHGKVEMTLAEAMTKATEEATPPKRGPGRPRKVAA